MDVGLDDPLQREPLRFDLGDELVRVVIGDPSGGIVDIHHGIDDRTGVGVRIPHDIADRIGHRIKMARDIGDDIHIHGVFSHGHLLRLRFFARHLKPAPRRRVEHIHTMEFFVKEADCAA